MKLAYVRNIINPTVFTVKKTKNRVMSVVYAGEYYRQLHSCLFRYMIKTFIARILLGFRQKTLYLKMEKLFHAPLSKNVFLRPWPWVMRNYLFGILSSLVLVVHSLFVLQYLVLIKLTVNILLELFYSCKHTDAKCHKPLQSKKY